MSSATFDVIRDGKQYVEDEYLPKLSGLRNGCHQRWLPKLTTTQTGPFIFSKFPVVRFILTWAQSHFTYKSLCMK